MSIKACLDRAAAMGVILKEEAEQLKARYDEIAASTLDSAEARAKMQAEVEAEARHRERAALLTEIARTRLMDELRAYRTAKGNPDLLGAWIAQHENMGHVGGFIQDIEGKRKAIVDVAQGELKDAILEFDRHWLTGDLSRQSERFGSQRQRTRMQSVMRELGGEDTGDALAKTIAAAWEKTSDRLRERFNAAGGAIGKLEKWMMPQAHSVDALLKATKAGWVKYMLSDGVLDRERMRNALTGEKLSEGDLTRALEVSWERIVTDGYSDKDVTANMGRGALYTQHADHRFLHFKNPDAWMAYAERFGSRDLFGTMMSHVGLMARDIAHMESFGPNPNVTRDWVKNWIRSEYAQRIAGEDATSPRQNKIDRALRRADGMWQVQRGIEPADHVWAQRMTSVRNVISAVSLQRAVLSAINDPMFGQDMRLRLGMSFARSNFGGLMARTLHEIWAKGGKEAALESMSGLEEASHTIRRQATEVGGWDHPFWTRYLADRTLHLTGLTPWTEAGKRVAKRDIMTHMGDHVGGSFADLPGGLQKGLRTHGFGPAEWDKIRSVEKSGGLLRPNEILEMADRPPAGSNAGAHAREWRDLGERYIQMLNRETRYAVPEATVASQAIIAANATPGDLVGEIVKSAAQFKSFGMTVWMLHVNRIGREIAAGDPHAGYGAALLFTGTMLGAMAMALKDISAGRDPRKWFDEDSWNKLDNGHWGAAILQSGGFGIYGDFMFSGTNRFGGGLTSTLAGPLTGKIAQILGVEAEIKSEKPNYGRWATDILRQNTPLVNNWLTGVVFQNVVMDALQRRVDPHAASSMAQKASKRMRDYKQDYWWRPGTSAPQRAPDLSRALSMR